MYKRDRERNSSRNRKKKESVGECLREREKGELKVSVRRK